MPVQQAPGLVAEVSCLNCGRVLAEAIRNEAQGTVQVRPAAHQPAMLVVVAGRRLLRCGRCGGRALIEPPLDAPDRRGALRTWLGSSAGRFPGHAAGRKRAPTA